MYKRLAELEEKEEERIIGDRINQVEKIQNYLLNGRI
jgi:hypothetical protein